jgi:integrase
VPFAEAAESWLAGKRSMLSSAKTLYDYGNIVTAHLVPALGTTSVTEITEDRILAFVAALRRKAGTRGRPLSNRRINIILIRLHEILKQAVRKGWLAQDPMVAVRLLREARPEIDPFSFEEVQRFLGHVPDTFRGYFATAFFTGLRPSD